MKNLNNDGVESRWARIGVMFNRPASYRTPDLERLVLESGAAVQRNARLFPLLATWLIEHGSLVAGHRLGHTVVAEGSVEDRAVLGLLLETAMAGGAARELRVPLAVCSPLRVPRPLFEIQRGNPVLESMAAEEASELSRKWGMLAPECELKRDAVRPISWILEHNPAFRDRAIRKGDLRCSILETLRWDTDGRVRSESALARLTGATRGGVRKALAALVREGEVVVGITENARDRGVALRGAA